MVPILIVGMSANNRVHSWFNQANKNVLIKGPLGKYPIKTAETYISEKLAANFRMNEERILAQVATAS